MKEGPHYRKENTETPKLYCVLEKKVSSLRSQDSGGMKLCSL